MEPLNEWGPLSRRLADVLFARFPGWRAYAVGDPERPGALVLEVPRPRGDGVVLHVDVDDEAEEITAGFGQWHTHFGAFFDADPSATVDQAMDLVNALVAGECAVGVSMRGDAWAGSRLFWRGDTVPPPAADVLLRVRTWTGAQDADLAPASPGFVFGS